MSQLYIREASLKDASRIWEIYAPYIRETTYTFEYEVPTLAEFEKRMAGIMERFPWLVCEEEGEIIGYAYADTYGVRAAYDWCVDLSVYVDMKKRGKGAGALLYRALFAVLKEMHFQNLYAVITGENTGSVEFHEKLGFETFAVYPKAGYKFGKWLDVIWMQLFLGEHENPPQSVIWAKDLERGRISEVVRDYMERHTNEV